MTTTTTPTTSSKEHRMNAHQRYVANLVAGLTPAQVAQWVAEPPTGRSQTMSAAELHELVKAHATPEVSGRWAALLADAADPQWADPKWVPQWATRMASMIFDLPVEEEEEGEAA